MNQPLREASSHICMAEPIEIEDVRCGEAASRSKFYSRNDLEVFNLLTEPIWVFDVSRKIMWWANNSALSMWNAETLDALLSRDFENDMSEATALRLSDYMEKFKSGETIQDQWTLYPNGKGPATVDVHFRGIYIKEGRLVMLCEGKVVPKDEIDHKSLRGVEMLRHLPVSVSQFDLDGNLMDQNPEAVEVFGKPLFNKKRTCDGSLKQCKECDFRSRFVDQNLGQKVFEEVTKGNDYCVEAQQHTRQGPRWSSIKVRLARDPVTGNPSILYSARDITDVIQAKKEADEANARKSEFLAVMAHEIRTPLHQAVGFIELLAQTNLNAEQSSHVSHMQNSAMTLMGVINDLLDYTKLEAGKMDLESIPFEAKAVVEGSVGAVSSQADEKDLTLITSIASGIPVKLVGDPNRLRQILLNLLNNAVKFTPAGGNITVSVTSRSDEKGRTVLQFSVQDTGIGISEQFRQQIFRKYQQADPSITRKYGGSGLGLTICKRLAHLMGGEIGVESEVGKGSNFWFELPFDDYKRFDSQPEDTVEQQEEISGLRVLVAEDNKVNQKVLTAMLKRFGHVVTVAGHGEEALEKLDGREFDLILMDIQMPILDGIEATKEIRSRGRTCPIIGVSASFQRSELPYYQQVGMSDCISKPVRMKDLRAAIRENVGSTKPRATEFDDV